MLHVVIALQSSAAASGTTRKDWMTGQSVYGELKDGHLVTVGLAHARRLLNPACAFLTRLGATIPFEVAVGVNGLVYVRAASSELEFSVLTPADDADTVPRLRCATATSVFVTAASVFAEAAASAAAAPRALAMCTYTLPPDSAGSVSSSQLAARNITVICNSIERCESLSEEDSVVLVERILSALAR